MTTEQKSYPAPSIADVAARIKRLQTKGYKRVWEDEEKRICVLVDETKYTPGDAELMRRVWRAEWPTVRSDKPDSRLPTNEQMQFRGRGY
jgi:SOS-response transcriptional repressor LexA